MKTDIILSGVGGQGILSIATIIGEAALHLGLNLKQAEVHGMSQRGGDVQSNLRLSDTPIAFKNIPNYPDEEKLMQELKSQPHVVVLDVENLAKENHMPKSANVILLGAAAPFLKILDAEVLRESVGRIFASKGEEVVQMNYRAFDIGHEYVKQLKF